MEKGCLAVGKRMLLSSFACAALSYGMPAYAASDDAKEMGAIRSAAERFKDVNVALAEGYIPDPAGMCVTAEMEGQPKERGAMGIHYFRPDMLGITGTTPRVAGTGMHTDFQKPAMRRRARCLLGTGQWANRCGSSDRQIGPAPA